MSPISEEQTTALTEALTLFSMSASVLPPETTVLTGMPSSLSMAMQQPISWLRRREGHIQPTRLTDGSGLRGFCSSGR